MADMPHRGLPPSRWGQGHENRDRRNARWSASGLTACRVVGKGCCCIGGARRAAHDKFRAPGPCLPVSRTVGRLRIVKRGQGVRGGFPPRVRRFSSSESCPRVRLGGAGFPVTFPCYRDQLDGQGAIFNINRKNARSTGAMGAGAAARGGSRPRPRQKARGRPVPCAMSGGEPAGVRDRVACSGGGGANVAHRLARPFLAIRPGLAFRPHQDHGD